MTHLLLLPGRARRRSGDPDGGFTIIESTLALSLIFGVVVALLSTLATGVRGVVTGRQRGVAVALANEVIETARARAYGDVGHDLDSDPTLATDPALTGTAPTIVYTGVGERLAASAVDAGAAAGNPTNPLFPFSPHRWLRPSEATTFTVAVYVTAVTPATGDPYKRLTVAVTWDRQVTSGAIPALVSVSSLLFDAVKPPLQGVNGVADASAGTLKVTGTIDGMQLEEAQITFPYSHGEVGSEFVRRAIGHVVSAATRLDVSSGSVTGCEVAPGALNAECPGRRVDTSTDNDTGTAQPEHNSAGPLAAPGGTVADPGGALRLVIGDGGVSGLGTTRSCWACFGPGVDDNDGLVYQSGAVTGPASVSVPFKVSRLLPAVLVEGDLMAAAAPCSTSCSTITLDEDAVGGSPRLWSSAAVAHPPVGLVAVGGRPPMVKVSATALSATATSGPAAPPPAVTGSAVQVDLYRTFPAAGYDTFTVTPGTALQRTSSASFAVGLAVVTLDATVRSAPKVTASTAQGGALTRAEASVSDWLTVEVHLVVTSALSTLADLTVVLSYGRVSTVAGYVP